VNLLQRARRRFDLANTDPDIWPNGINPMFGLGRAVNGEEKPLAADYIVAAEAVFKRNGPVAALMFVRQLVFSEARFQYRRREGGRPGDLFGNAALGILETPWRNATTGDLLSRMIQDADLGGNAFFTIVDGVDGPRIRRLRPDWVTIVTGSELEPDLYGDAIDGDILGYIYSPRSPGTDQGDVLFPEQVAHFAPIPDPEYQFRGMSWLTPVLREVQADGAATSHKLNFFRNGASPQLVVSLDSSVTPDMFERFKAKMDLQHSGVSNAYKTLYLGGGADVTVAGADLRQLDFKATQGAGETRLASAAGVPPVIVGFSEGLAGSSLNAGNYAASRRRMADATMRPLWRNAAGSLATLIEVPGGAELWYDDRDIAFLREDRADVATIQASQAQTIRTLVDAGYEPGSVVAAVQAEDYSLLKHTGLFSVQLQPPANGEMAGAPAAENEHVPAGPAALAGGGDADTDSGGDSDSGSDTDSDSGGQA
jgi:phage portal protein BeeE